MNEKKNICPNSKSKYWPIPKEVIKKMHSYPVGEGRLADDRRINNSHWVKRECVICNRTYYIKKSQILSKLKHGRIAYITCSKYCTSYLSRLPEKVYYALREMIKEKDESLIETWR